MRLFIQLENGVPKSWPLVGENVRYLAPPGVAFPGVSSAYEEVDLSEFGFETFAEAEKPAFDPLTQKIVEAAPLKVDGVWTRQWEVVPLTTEEATAATQAIQAALMSEVTVSAQARLDAFARTRSYDGILSACTYDGSTVPKFAAEGRYCVQARDATWSTLYAILAQVESGSRPMPSCYADIEPELPVLAWPA